MRDLLPFVRRAEPAYARERPRREGAPSKKPQRHRPPARIPLCCDCS
jgi:hypothetical protein